MLFTVVRCGPIGMSELAREEDLNPTMLSRVVARLADEGLLERTPHPDDGRAVVVRRPTPGSRLRDETPPRPHRRPRPRARRPVTPRTRAALEAALPVLERLAARR